MSRHKARCKALELLFSREFHKENDIQYNEDEIFSEDEIVEADEAAETNEAAEAADMVNEYSLYILNTVSEHKDTLDELIQSYATGWDISRLSNTDRNILRLALCELVYPKEPLAPSIVLNEAILLAKAYGGEKSSRFVNGVLGAYVRAQSE